MEITVKSSSLHQQLDQGKTTTFFHFFSSFVVCFFDLSGNLFADFCSQIPFATAHILHNIKTSDNTGKEKI